MAINIERIWNIMWQAMENLKKRLICGSEEEGGGGGRKCKYSEKQTWTTIWALEWKTWKNIYVHMNDGAIMWGNISKTEKINENMEEGKQWTWKNEWKTLMNRKLMKANGRPSMLENSESETKIWKRREKIQEAGGSVWERAKLMQQNRRETRPKTLQELWRIRWTVMKRAKAENNMAAMATRQWRW